MKKVGGKPMQVSNSSVARPWKLEQNISGQASKKVPVFGPQNVGKRTRAKLDFPSMSVLVLKSAQQTGSARLLAILIQTFKDFPSGKPWSKLMLKELVLMERSWHREAQVVLTVCVCWQESFLCVQGQKRLSSALSFWQRRAKASSGLTQVSDIIRQIDVGLSRFRKMIETLPAAVSRVGLEVQTSDLTIMLLRSLTHDVRSYATLHAAAQ